ncbi:efflux transporter outer membrane subunit [Noviherbaspirillum aerium]|uniref:efflux transporter outer membrane subunit n=1 Tax=Noviherbaspirillum aerium TaxID=2588497 RepID=UPI00124DAED4|nr:efflux transporter outer membrane subunit [Noviherbaspirillum aerium]
MKIHRIIALAFLPCMIASCAVQAPPAHVDAMGPASWGAALPETGTRAASSGLPHGGTLAGIADWWKQTDDAQLPYLLESAQLASPTVSAAASRISQARAARVGAGAALLPTLDSSLSATRARSQPPTPTGAALQAGLQTAWEIDVFGANAATRDAAAARLEGAQAAWHEARVSVAAETANLYYQFRTCELLLAITRSDAQSRAESARLAQLALDAGFQSPANAALARASAAEGNNRATQQQAQCDIDIKALTALTALPEAELRQRLAVPSRLPENPVLAIDHLPAAVLAQRPDVFNAEREVAAASAEAGAALAQRFPRLSLSGSVSAIRFRTGGADTDLSTWSIGPLALTLPLFDGGRRAANIEAAQARYDDAVIRYRAQVRQAVREVEEALVRLQSTASRSDDARIAAEGYRASFNATEARYRGGLGSLLELEESRRTRLAAELALAALQQERIAAWIALYRAAGGGWNAPSAQAAAAKTTTTTTQAAPHAAR